MFSNITSEINKITNKLAGSSVATAKSVAKAISQLSEYINPSDDSDSSNVFIARITFGSSSTTYDNNNLTKKRTTPITSIDCSYNDMKTAFDAGKLVYVLYLDEGFVPTQDIFSIHSIGPSQGSGNPTEAYTGRIDTCYFSGINGGDKTGSITGMRKQLRLRWENDELNTNLSYLYEEEQQTTVSLNMSQYNS